MNNVKHLSLHSHCRHCWGCRCRPPPCPPDAAPCCLAGSLPGPRCGSTRSGRTSWGRGSSYRWAPSTNRSQWSAGSLCGHSLDTETPIKSKIKSCLYTLEVALPAACPDVVEILLLDEALNPVLLRLGLDGDRVHAELPAVVPRTLPVPLRVFANGQPGKVVVFVEPSRVYNPCNK